MPEPISIDWSNFCTNTLLLTVNKRLSRWARTEFDKYQKALGKSAWASLNSVSLDGWLQSLWDQLQCISPDPLPRLLNTNQEALVWQRIVKDELPDLVLFNAPAAASTASNAWHTLIQWQQDPLTLDRPSPFDSWAQCFADMSKAHNWVDRSSAYQMIVESIVVLKASLPKHVALLGFDDPSPQTLKLFDALKEQGVVLTTVTKATSPDTLACTEAPTLTHELSACARWAKRALDDNHDVRIGIVVPKLSAHRALVHRCFSECFEPQALHLGTEHRAPGFNISIGERLSDTPLIHSALLCLTLNRPSVAMDDITQWLHSPFIGHSDEFLARSELSDKLSSRNVELTLSQLVHQAGRHASIPLTQRRLEQCLEQQRSSSLRLPASQWADVFSRQLTVLGWPGSRTFNTLEHQQYQRWQDVLESWAETDHMKSSLNALEALDQLQFLCSQQLFQPQTNDSPIQILSLFDAAHLPFDYLWITGCDSHHWPAPTTPNPLIPIERQKTLNMPNANAEHERELASLMTKNFSQAATHIVFSYAATEDDAEREMSRLIRSIDFIPIDIVSPQMPAMGWPNYDTLHTHVIGLETRVDDTLRPIDNTHPIKGGSQILKNQAACPFKATAIHRLKATRRDEPTPGLNAAERGNIVHRVLSLVWETLEHSSALTALNDEQQTALIDSSIERALAELKHPAVSGERFHLIEHQRLHQLVQRWLIIEKQRPPFSVVHNETSVDITIAELPIRLRYDRVDKLDDGRLFVIDYKTGKVNVSQWTGERPDEPQVPLYCLANHSEAIAGAFGQINADDVRFIGLSDDTDIAPGLTRVDRVREGLPDNWPDTLDHWQQQLHQLARDFLAGKAHVDPKRSSTCRYCDLSALCRLHDEIPNAT